MAVSTLSRSAHPAKSRSTATILWSYARPHLPQLVLGLLLTLAGSTMGLASPLVTRWILDSLEAGQALTQPILLLVGLLVVGTGLGWWTAVLLGSVAETVVRDARRGMITRYLFARVLALVSRPTGELVTRVTSDSVLLQAASTSVIGLFNGAVMLVGTLVLMAILDLALLTTTAVAVGIVVILFATLMPAIAVARQRAQEAVGSLGGRLESLLRAVRTVKVSNAEERQVEDLMKHANEARTQGIRATRREALAWTLAWAGVQAAIIVILGFGAVRVAQGDMSVSTLIAFLLYAFGLLGPIMELSSNLTSLQSGIAAAGRIREIDDMETEQDHGGTAAVRRGQPRPASAGPILELRDVTARYTPDGDPAVDGLSLAFPAHGHTALVGPSGAGKTTLLSLLLRFVHPESGEVRIRGTDYSDLTPTDIRGHFAYVEQETPIVPGTIRENLLFANPGATDAEIGAVLEDIHLADKILSLPDGLDTRLSETSVSGGQRQRIALARAILAKRDILLLDEATAQVDGLTEMTIQQTVRRLAAESCVITVAHRLSTIMDADNIVVMADGRIQAQGRHHELIETSPLYAGLVEALRIRHDAPLVEAAA